MHMCLNTPHLTGQYISFNGLLLYILVPNNVNNAGISSFIYYPPEVRIGQYWGLGVFLLEYLPVVKI